MSTEPNIRDLKKQAEKKDRDRLKELEEILTPKQLAFCQYYIINQGNATQAAIDAGYSKKHARSIGSENLTKPDIKEYVGIFSKIQEDARVASAGEVLRTLTQIMRGEIEITVQKAKTKGRGESAEQEVIIEKHKASHRDRILAARTLGDYHGMWREGGQDLKNLEVHITIDGQEYGEEGSADEDGEAPEE